MTFPFIFENNNKEPITQALKGENNNSTKELFRTRSLFLFKKNPKQRKPGEKHESSRQKQESLLVLQPLSLVLS